MPRETELSRLVARLDAKLDSIAEVTHDTNREMAAMAVKVGAIEQQVKLTNGRVMANTRGRYLLTGAIGVLLALIGWVGYVLFPTFIQHL